MKRLLPLVCLLAAVSCSSIKTSYDYDKSVDFSKFKTYGYTDEAMKLPIQELNKNRVFAAIDKEMTAKGFTKSGSPDVWVDVQVKAERKQEATATTTGPGMYGGYYGRGYMYGGGFTTTQVNYNDYIEGTLFISMVNNNNLIWQGRGTATIDEDASPEKREKNINYGVAEIFRKYPPPPKK